MRRLLVLLAITVAATTSSAFAASLTVSSWHLWAGTQSLTKSQCTVTGSSSIDRHLRRPVVADVELRVEHDAERDARRVHVGEMGVRALQPRRLQHPSTGGADSAQLVLTIASTPKSSRTLTITPVLSSWATTLTWNQAQSLSYGAATTTVATGTTTGATLTATVTVDVDALIRNGSANFGWRIERRSARRARTRSRMIGARRGGGRLGAAAARDQLSSNGLRQPIALPAAFVAAFQRTNKAAGIALAVLACLFWMQYLRPVSLGGHAGYVLVSGHSMEPRFHTGDLVLVEQQSSSYHGR